ncbi:uncharacterized protein LOC115824894 [Chanos chanos]|uniref:Uncharacterized protein LOC115824894 n=1 Tax=Chanos chanos TaxID=29144 RepID=A0A6J2WLG4_CHACN|nr:uncharacterized protein LOC115824894 [Chanos chanos]
MELENSTLWLQIHVRNIHRGHVSGRVWTGLDGSGCAASASDVKHTDSPSENRTPNVMYKTPNFRNQNQHPFQNRGPQMGGGFKPLDQGNAPNQGTPQKPPGSSPQSDIPSPPQQAPDLRKTSKASAQPTNAVQVSNASPPKLQSPQPGNINAKPDLASPQNEAKKNKQKSGISNGQKWTGAVNKDRTPPQEPKTEDNQSPPRELKATLSLLRKPGEKTYTRRHRLHVGNLPNDITEAEFRELFVKYGELSEVFINQSKGFGFIKLESRALAEIAKAELDDVPVKGRPLRVRFATHPASLSFSDLSPCVSSELPEEALSQSGTIERAVLIEDDHGQSTGKGIVEFSLKPAPQKAYDPCDDGVFLLTSSPRPVGVESLEQYDDEDGLPEKLAQRTPNDRRKRERPPRLARPGTFESEDSQRWKSLDDMEEQQRQQLEKNIRDARRKLEAEMEDAYHEHQDNMLRQDSLRRQEEMRRMEEMHNQEMQKQKEIQLRQEEEHLRRDEEMLPQGEMEEQMRRKRKEPHGTGGFMDNRGPEMRMNPGGGLGMPDLPPGSPNQKFPLAGMGSDGHQGTVHGEMVTYPLIQESLALESDDDCNFSSDESGEDSDEERCHFEFRLDPAEDACDQSEENIAPVRKKARCQQPLSWNTESDGDAVPPPLRFLPAREPGVQLSTRDSYTPLDLFKLFFSEDAVETLCRNTNKQAARNAARGAKYRWTDVGVAEFYRYIGLIFYMAMIKLDHITDYWRKNSIFSILFPSQVMSRDRYRSISWNVHMSDPDEDRVNDDKKGTSEHDRLFRVKPLMCTIQTACKAFYHPCRNLAVDERMVPCKGHTGMTQYMKDKPTKWGFKLFVLADSSNGYTVDFSVYTGKNNFPTGQGLSYDSVMSLIDKRYLGSGYHVYMDNFYTSPKLFKDLFAIKFGACGTYRESRGDFPRTAVNALTKKSPRGTFRWIRDGPLLFVKWMDTREVSVCSTIHTAYTGDTVQRRLKSRQGVWSTESFPCPSPVVEYNKLMGGVDLSDQLIQYYTTQHKTLKWYRKLFLHFLDIAATNAYILHKELLQKDSMTHKAFMEELTAQLCGVTQKTQKTPTKKTTGGHVPVPGAEVVADSRMKASVGRRTCAYCRMHRGKNTKTPWKCKACDVYLCLQPDRNCFEAWHPDQD